MTNFRIGDEVIITNGFHYSITTTGSIGKITEILEDGLYEIVFSYLASRPKENKGNHIPYPISGNTIKLNRPPLTKEQKLQNKCKELWNQSKYVKKTLI